MFTVKPLNKSSKFGLQIWIWPRAGTMLNIAIYSRDIQGTTCSAALHCCGVKSYAFQCCSGNVGASAKTTYVKPLQKYYKYQQVGKVYKLATAVVGGADLDEALLSDLKQWKILAQSFCFAQRQ